MDSKKKMTGMIIHGFAVAHAAAAALLAQTLVGDEAVLTALTIAMIIAVAKMNGADWDTGAALAFLGICIGGYVGVRGATFLIKIIPGIGNVANATVTFTTTEVLGWATYLFIKKGNSDPRAVTKAEKKALWKEAKSMQKQEKQESKHLYDAMSDTDKNEYESIMKQLKIKDLPEETRSYLLSRLEVITRKYIDS